MKKEKKELIEEIKRAAAKSFSNRLYSGLLMVFNEYDTHFIERAELEPKSVEELKEKMGDSYNDKSVKVSYKEGYNRALKDITGTPVEEEGIKIVPSDRIDYCCECEEDHGYICPQEKKEECKHQKTFKVAHIVYCSYCGIHCLPSQPPQAMEREYGRNEVLSRISNILKAKRPEDKYYNYQEKVEQIESFLRDPMFDASNNKRVKQTHIDKPNK